MKNKKPNFFSSLIFSILLFSVFAQAQTSQVTVSLNEQFFDALLDAIFTNLNKPDFPLASNSSRFKARGSKLLAASYDEKKPADAIAESKDADPFCDEKLTLQREINGVRTAVRFRDGKIYAPIAFTGSYNPPLIGCLDFQGFAETNIELEFDRQQQMLIGRVKVLNVKLGGAANMAGGFIAKLVQNSIDKKINPVEILRTEKLSFVIPVQNSGGALKMRATGLRHEIGNGYLNIYVNFEFAKN